VREGDEGGLPVGERVEEERTRVVGEPRVGGRGKCGEGEGSGNGNGVVGIG
jgi:hypothetical protein